MEVILFLLYIPILIIYSIGKALVSGENFWNAGCGYYDSVDLCGNWGK